MEQLLSIFVQSYTFYFRGIQIFALVAMPIWMFKIWKQRHTLMPTADSLSRKQAVYGALVSIFIFTILNALALYYGILP